LIDGIEAMALSTATLTLALLGAGVWALVVGGLVGGAVGAALSFRWGPHRLAWPRDFRRIAEDVIFGGKVLGSQLAWYLYNNADFAAVGRVLGAGPLGLYTLGWTLANVPVDRVSGLLTRVTPAYFAALSDDRPELRRYLLLLTEGLALFTFPACVGLALVADDLVYALLGTGWAPAVGPLRILALIAAGRSLFVLAAPILNFTGQVDRNLRFSVLLALLLPPSFAIAAHWGISAVAAVWGVVYPVIAIRSLFAPALRAVGLGWRTYLGALRTPALATLVMTVVVLAISRADGVLSSRLGRPVVEAAFGAVAYTGVVLLLARERIRGVLGMLRGTIPPLPTDRPPPPASTPWNCSSRRRANCW
jgi:PST family polysaccharide transporter